jgi:hypothetical protein
MPTTTFTSFKESVVSRCFPHGPAENLEVVINKLIVEALVLVQRYVDCYQASHTDVLSLESGTFTRCGTTFLARPRGHIIRIVNRWRDSDVEDSGTDTAEAAEEDDCNRFTYEKATLEEVETVGNRFRDMDRSTCRLNWGVYAESGNAIVLAPSLRDVEQIELQWSGIKRDYAGLDIMPDDPELESTVSHYVSMEVARRYDKDIESFNVESVGWRDKIAEMVHDCARNGVSMVAEVVDDFVRGLRFSFTSDAGHDNTDQKNVAAFIHSRNPDLLLFGGDNNHPDGAANTLQDNWAVYQVDINRSRVFPALGNHDLDTLAGANQVAYFNSPGNGRYYRHRVGIVEFFCLNSGLDSAAVVQEPDGIQSTQTQGQWLQAALADSEAKWKVVYFHHAPYSNSTVHGPGLVTMRWPFKDWGADVVLTGHNHHYERLIVDDFPYIVCGTGGSSLYDFIASPTAESLVRIKEFGALIGEADNKKLLLRFYTTDGVLKDIHAIT